jgi:FkbM family methyltransferase
MGTDTKILEIKGWNGILIEPSEGLYLFCKNTRNCIVENYALVSDSYNNDTISDIVVFTLPDYITGYTETNNIYKTITFNNLIKKHNINKVDIFVLDVEGYELEILKGINFDEVEITNFIIEWKLNELDQLDNFMISKGYENLGMVEMLDPKINLADFYYKKK